MKPRITSSTGPEQWPVLMNKHEVALVLGRSVRTLVAQCMAGRVEPPPITDRRGDFRTPFMWNREVVRRYCEGLSDAVRLRRAS